MENKLQIRICEKCETKVIPTQEHRCPACQTRSAPLLGPEQAINKQVDDRFSWMALLVLVGIIVFAASMKRHGKERSYLKLVA